MNPRGDRGKAETADTETGGERDVHCYPVGDPAVTKSLVKESPPICSLIRRNAHNGFMSAISDPNNPQIRSKTPLPALNGRAEVRHFRPGTSPTVFVYLACFCFCFCRCLSARLG
jgi:hypothetical protein